jgi:hypothetical protein
MSYILLTVSLTCLVTSIRLTQTYDTFVENAFSNVTEHLNTVRPQLSHTRLRLSRHHGVAQNDAARSGELEVAQAGGVQ